MSESFPRTTSTSDSRINCDRKTGNDGASNRSPLSSRRINESSADKATTAFIRRTLCAHQIQISAEKGRGTPRPVEDLLPPLTSSNAVDVELYAFIAIIIKDFVYPWYAKVTPDHVFTDEIVKVIAHCTRQLEQRLRHVDFELLLLDDVPALLDQHVSAYRTALEASQPQTLAADLHQAYYSLHPHPALAPVPDASETTREAQQENEAIWRQLLVRGILAVLLPTEDLENPCLRALVAEILSEMVLGNAVFGRGCEPWMLWESVIRVIETLRPREGTPVRSADGNARDGPSRLEHFGLVSSREELLKPVESHSAAKGSTMSVSELGWAFVQYAFLAFTAMRACFVILVSSSSLPPRISSSNAQTSDAELRASPHREGLAYSNSQAVEKRPLVSMSVWSCFSHLVELELRVPWLAGFLSLLHQGLVHGIGKVGDTNGVLDRILSHQLRTRVQQSAALPPLLRALRAALFPNNNNSSSSTLAPSRPAPTTAEQALEVRRRAAHAVLDALPDSFCRVYFASGDREEWLVAVEGWLDVLGDPYLNRHLVVRLVEVLVVRVVPELGGQGAEELLRERLEGL